MSAFPAGAADVALARLFPEPNPWLTDPVGWIGHKLDEFAWSKQREIGKSIVENRYTAVQSCHDSGKSYFASRVAAWWLTVHAPGEAFLVSSAPTQSQVEAILWREIGRAHRKGDLEGRITYGKVPEWKFGNEIVGYGRKPQGHVNQEEAMAAFQGIHARYVLVVLDEAGGIPKWLFDAADALATNVHARVLAIGNPDDPQSHFVREVMKPGSVWNRIHIDGYETPNFTGEEVPDDLRELLLSVEWVEEKKKTWGESSPIFESKVRGRAPKIDEWTVFAPSLLEAACENELPGTAKGRFGADIAREGEDSTEVYRNRGGVIRHVKSGPKQDTMATTGMLVAILRPHAGAVAMVVDAVGVGAGVFDRGRELGEPMIGFNAGERAFDPERFVDRRAEIFWALRTAMEDDEIDLDAADDELLAQLGALRWELDSKGRIRIESKRDMRKRGLPSPDKADAAAMSFIGGDGALPHVPAPHERTPGLTDDLLGREM